MLPTSRHALRLPLRTLRRDFTHFRRCLATVKQKAAPKDVVQDVVEEVLNKPAAIKLRQYQEECIQSVLSYLDQGHKRLGISLATGSGKTVIFTQLIDRVKNLSNGAHQTLILAHRQELVEQAAKHCTLAYPSKTVEIEMGKIHASGDADITIASVSSIISKSRIEKFNPESFKLILVDEAHHIVAPGYLKTLKHFDLDKTRSCGPALVGVSATLSRFDGLRLGAAIDHVVYHKDYIDMIGENWLSNVVFTTVSSNADISRVKKGVNGDFLPSDLSRVVNTEQINEITVRSWLAKAGERKSTLVFCVDVAHIKDLTAAFRDRGIDARYVTGETPKVERSQRLDAFRNGEFPVLINCGVFTEGTDVPNIDCVILARPTKSRNLLVQMIGRGMRLFPGKENCHIIDMVASLETGIISTPTLFGLDPHEIVKEATVEDLQRLKEEKEAAPEKGAQMYEQDAVVGGVRVTFTDYESVFDLIEDSSRERHVRALSPHAWVEAAGKYILSLPVGKYLKIALAESDPEDIIPRYTVEEIIPYTGLMSKNKYRAPVLLAENMCFEDAVHAADTYAKIHYPRPLIAHNMRWRKGPATQSQIDFLNKFRERTNLLKVGEGGDRGEGITKGKAQDMITKLRHGARGRWTEVQKEKLRWERREEKKAVQEVIKRREVVSVGPMKN